MMIKVPSPSLRGAGGSGGRRACRAERVVATAASKAANRVNLGDSALEVSGKTVRAMLEKTWAWGYAIVAGLPWPMQGSHAISCRDLAPVQSMPIGEARGLSWPIRISAPKPSLPVAPPGL